MSSARASMASMLAVVTALLAQVSFRVGPVPYPMQNTGVIISGLLLPPRWALASQLLYLLMMALGAPVAAGFRGGVSVLFGPTGGYLAGFPIAAFLMSLLREWYLKSAGKHFAGLGSKNLAVLWLLSALSVVPLYVLGFIVFSYWASINPSLLTWALDVAGFFELASDIRVAVAVASVLIFVPQDLLMDHVLALIVAQRVARALPSEYCALTGDCVPQA
uniref:Biotin transporter BioY n=1 Tax=Thermofilum adornatum TaxID=1365176 RepID=A0A7C1CE94_9CREN